MFFHKIKVDPAVASGPLITTVNDLVAVLTYYGMHEQASYYALRQICTARMLMFAVVDLVIVMVFLAITYQTTILSLSD